MHVSSDYISYMLYVSACDFQKLFWKQLVSSETQYFLLRVVRTAMVSNRKQSILMCVKAFVRLKVFVFKSVSGGPHIIK